ncbi:uncharacterized protein METZ01_LOCUS396396, partial [marine metagenome]
WLAQERHQVPIRNLKLKVKLSLLFAFT